MKLFTLGLGLLVMNGGAAADLQVASPDGNVVMAFALQPGGVPAYRIAYAGNAVVLDSRLGLEPNLLDGFTVVATQSSEHRNHWENRLGERRDVPDNYNELDVDLRQASGIRVRLEFRAYDEGAALRYALPAQSTESLTFSGERTEFRFPAGTYGWEEHATEGEYRRALIKDFEPWCERPVTLEYASGIYAALMEAANQDYPRMLLSPLPGVPGALVSALGGTTANTVTKEFAQRGDPTVHLRAGATTPWRFFVVGHRPGDLLERNYLLLDLNPPSAVADTSWIVPGQAMRDTALTTVNSKAIIDFAATAGLRYVALDWKWYGPVEYESAGETIPRAPNLDIPEIVRYGRAKGVGLILYVDRRQVKRERDALFARLESWGVVGAKIGFVDVGPQSETAWITTTIQKAAEHHLMLDIHDGYRSTGLSRTWPNLMTVEGIRGNEHFPTAEHNCTLPFTRYLAGCADYTVCYYDKRLQTTHAHQLAMAVISFSPLQWILWYDKPADYHGEPEIEFFRHMATVWDETRLVDGKIGAYAIEARRSGQDWFVGAINAREPRKLRLPLDFLPAGARYTAHLYADDPTVRTRTQVSVRTESVDRSTVLDLSLALNGGEAIWLERLEAK